MRNCLYCGKSIENKHGKALYCCSNHRVYHFKFGPKLASEVDILLQEIKEKIDEMPEESTRVSVILRKVVNELSPGEIKYPVPEIDRVPPDQNNPKWMPVSINFGDDKFLVIEKYTKYPLSQRPEDKAARAIFDSDKKKSDNVIRDLWKKRHKN